MSDESRLLMENQRNALMIKKLLGTVALLEKRLKNNSHTDERLIYLTYYKHFSEKNKGNFGDELSPYIVQKMADCEVRHVDITMRDKLCAIGSMICPYTLPSGTIFWGTGTHHPKMPKKPARTGTSFRAVRGPITRRIVQDADIRALKYMAIRGC
jgi:hypothetical protein